MKRIRITVLLLTLASISWSQEVIEKLWHPALYEQELRFLASDELKGRNTGTAELDIAARYIAEVFRRNGLLPLPGMDSYFQEVPFKKTTPGTAQIRFMDTTFQQGDNVVMMSGSAVDEQAVAVFVGFGDSLRSEEINGKYVISIFGTEAIRSPMEALQTSKEKLDQCKALGAKGLLEIYTMQTPWSVITRFFNRERLELAGEDQRGEEQLPYGLMQIPTSRMTELRNNPVRPFRITFSGQQSIGVPSYNVLAYKPGNDPKRTDDYVLLSAHYDHIGTRSRAEGEPINQDTIFNGARDNGMGVIALLSGADVLSHLPVDRSLIFAAWTAEEKGLLGSSYFVDHSPVPLEKIRFNLNTDGAGYSDTTVVSILGFTRVGAETEMEKACQAFGLSVVADPAKEQNLFDRSDNVRFAAKGIPAPTFSPGFKSFDQEIQTYYHQVTDNPGSINYRYANKYWKAFVYGAYLIAQMPEDPRWSEGDKYEAAAKSLYGDNY
ncbi:MAG: M28 family peptidase [Saprospiraceae bacterium]|nr:M28 family peptidase [Saprospiraceae bacterium]